MTSLTRIFVVVCGLVLAAVPSHAADRSEIKSTIEQMAIELNLTEAQRQAVRPILAEGLEERAAILKSAGFEMGKKPTLRQLWRVSGPIKASRARTEKRLAEVLSPRQITRYREIVDEMRKKFRARSNEAG